MNKPTLVIMAAGLGSRYGGLKQIAPVDETGHIMMDYSMYDARRAGFDRVVCIINPLLEQDFRAVVGDRIARHMEVLYAYQTVDALLPAGFTVPEGRTKPWGTAHAVLCAARVVDGPFAVINADDFYGAAAFQTIYDFLTTKADSSHHAMVGYQIENTLTEHGHVARGVCVTDHHGNLLEIVERTHIEAREGGAAYTEDGESFTFLPAGTTVSMNMWGFDRSMLREIVDRFADFLTENLPTNPLKCEYFLPSIPNALLAEGKAEIQVLPTQDRWYGVTYAQDMPVVRDALAAMKAQGQYPEYLWEVAGC